MTPPDAVNTVSLKDLSATLARRKGQILITFILVIGGVFAITFLMPKRYQTRMKVLVKNERADMIVSADRNGGPGYRAEVSEAQSIPRSNSHQRFWRGDGVRLDKLESTNGAVARTTAGCDRRPSGACMTIQVAPVREANIIRSNTSLPTPTEPLPYLHNWPIPTL
jgi:hypothetical protein